MSDLKLKRNGASHRGQAAEIKKIAILRALYLGDLLLAVPALRAIRAGFPGAEITLIGLPWAASFASRFSCYIDRFVEFAGYPGIKEVPPVPEKVRRFLDEQRSYGYDLAIQMHGDGRSSNKCILALKARMTAGYYEHTPPPGLTLGLLYPADQPEVLRNLGLAQLVGCRDLDPGLEFPLFKADRAEAGRLLSQLREAAHPLIGMHAGSRSPARRWPAEYFARVADSLAERHGAQIILTGSASERSIVRAVAEQMVTKPVNLAGRTSLGGLAALISQLDLFISNDTGPVHIAYALGTPSITIFGPTDPGRWAALDQALHPVVRQPVACSPCTYGECPIDHRCLRWLKPERVIEMAGELLVKGSVRCSA